MTAAFEYLRETLIAVEAAAAADLMTVIGDRCAGSEGEAAEAEHDALWDAVWAALETVEGGAS